MQIDSNCITTVEVNSIHILFCLMYSSIYFAILSPFVAPVRLLLCDCFNMILCPLGLQPINEKLCLSQIRVLVCLYACKAL